MAASALVAVAPAVVRADVRSRRTRRRAPAGDAHPEPLGAGGAIAKAALDESWATLRTMHEQLVAMQESWNTLAQRVYEEFRAVES